MEFVGVVWGLSVLWKVGAFGGRLGGGSWGEDGR